MKASISLTLLLGLGLVLAAPALADDGEPKCSVRDLAGRWIFATEVGQLPSFGGDITAIGTMNFDREGNLHGKFDNNIAEVASFLDVEYSGTAEVDPDCTGTLTFETSDGFVRTDSIAVVSRNEMWGMSLDPTNLWTYRVRRISRRLAPEKGRK